MKLYEVWNAKAAWKTLAALKKPPGLAYKLLAYQKRVIADIEVCEEQRQRYVYEVSGAEPGTAVELALESPEFAEYNRRFQEFMRGDSELQWVGVSMDALVEALNAQAGNVISEDELACLEPFFTEPKP